MTLHYPAAMNDDDEPSPCIKLCMIYPAARICAGCFRSLDEIAAWSRMANADRAALKAELPRREPWLKQRRGGHRTRTAGS